MYLQLSLLFPLLSLVLGGPTAKRAEPAPLLIPRGNNISLVPEEYIVKLKQGSALGALEDAMKIMPGGAGRVFDSIFKGFTGKLNPATLAALRAHPDVDYVEQNALIQAYGTVTQSQAPWGLARISHKRTGASKYIYDSKAGAGTCAYVVDSGLDDSHPDFEGRAKFVARFIGNSNKDNCLHGTHVAGTIASKTFGVAKKANVYGIKVLELNSRGECGAEISTIIAGMEEVAKDVAKRKCPKGVVVNMSLGGGKSQSLNNAAAALVKKGYFVAVAAGNGDENGVPQDSNDFSPASEPSVCTVGSVDARDQTAPDTNYGNKVDIHAPGVDVLSTRVGGGSLRMSGTSMATPHVAGLGAYFLSLDKSPASNMCAYLQKNALQGVIGDLNRGTRNLLAQNGVGA
ncbi:subtilisin-like protease PR1G [Metarhizium rileyi]|uniref:Subtilisin-like protease PR1G n=1 Tax=Metarhizium rileyi (strain RCEF 4871) TaxID=1649241 RepID=A0A166WSY8_METRR|nr:subtilisin-like protease PR1G [Metarhizium rileyi RCEF 4871]TWU71695.1 subtilisin-like serine protease [Metarhizium rileyi]